MTIVAAAKAQAPEIDWAALSPLLALFAGAIIVLLLGLARTRPVRTVLVPFLTLVSLGAAIGLSAWQWGVNVDLVEGAMRADDLTMGLTIIFAMAGIGAVLLSWRHIAPREAAHGEYYALMLSSVAGMVVLVGANDLVTLFLGLELLSIPLYVLCATEMRRVGSLESGLKYLIIGSVGSATLLFGSALIYGAAGSTGFPEIAKALADPAIADSELLLAGVALVLIGLAFKASIAPFHQWTPDVYEGAPTPVTAFMAVATKAAAIGITLRLFDMALLSVSDIWQPAMAALAVVTIIVGNVGALGQRSLKRMLAYSGVAQAGYLLVGIIAASQGGVSATVFYLAAYTVMNLAVFAVIVARQAQRTDGDDIDSLRGLAFSHPLLAWPLTLGLLGLAGFPLTAGFVGKFSLITEAIERNYTPLGVMIVIGSMISLGYYLKIVALVWTPADVARVAPTASDSADTDSGGGGLPALAGASGEAEATVTSRAPWEVVAVGVVFAALTVALGVYPQPVFDFARDAGEVFLTLAS